MVRRLLLSTTGMAAMLGRPRPPICRPAAPPAGRLCATAADLHLDGLLCRRECWRRLPREQQQWLQQRRLLTNGNNTGFLGTVRGRAGIAIDRLLVYGTGGVAFGINGNNWPNNIVGTIGGVPTFFTTNSGNNMRVGYAAGAGVEYAFTPNWSVKVEYLFTDLGRNNRTFVTPGGLSGFTFNNREQTRIVRAGLNYRFGWAGAAPVLARY